MSLEVAEGPRYGYGLRHILQRLRPWAPLPLRLGIGIALMFHGGIKLFVPGGHENISHLVSQLGFPLPDLMGWVVGMNEFFGGLGMVLGMYLPLSAGLNALNMVNLLVLGALAGGIPEPLPGGDPLPPFREGFIILAGTLTLVMGGGGRLSVDEWRRASYTAPKGLN